MNDLYRLIELKNTTIRQIARDIGVEYHSLQKVFKGIRKTPAMRQAIAAFFHVTPEALWGPKSNKVITYLMEQEIEHQASSRREELKNRYLRDKAA
jgi:lambda repressor-like predicted transcriptional regulator